MAKNYDEFNLLEQAYLYMRAIRERTWREWVDLQEPEPTSYTQELMNKAYEVEEQINEYLRYLGMFNHINGLEE